MTGLSPLQSFEIDLFPLILCSRPVPSSAFGESDEVVSGICVTFFPSCIAVLIFCTSFNHSNGCLVIFCLRFQQLYTVGCNRCQSHIFTFLSIEFFLVPGPHVSVSFRCSRTIVCFFFSTGCFFSEGPFSRSPFFCYTSIIPFRSVDNLIFLLPNSFWFLENPCSVLCRSGPITSSSWTWCESSFPLNDEFVWRLALFAVILEHLMSCFPEGLENRGVPPAPRLPTPCCFFFLSPLFLSRPPFGTLSY